MADREVAQKLLAAQTELQDCADELQGLKDTADAYEHKFSVQNTKIGELQGKLQEKTTQNRLDAAEIRNIRDRVGDLKTEVDWFKTRQYPYQTPSGALVYGSASMSLINTVSPPI